MNKLDQVEISGDWLKDHRLQKVFDVLDVAGEATHVAGGAVRNALMGLEVSDVDLCTTIVPDEVVRLCKGAGIKTVPTGIEHGTVTVVVDGANYEVTTLREDVETDGRHAIVRFGRDWHMDAERRDLTMNALYCNRTGEVFDPLSGFEDIQSRQIRFIGDANLRIREDALRILRFFRFFAWYGHGRPDAVGLKACAANRGLIGNLSSERVWAELKKLLTAEDPGRALLWMRTTGVLGHLLPESEKWGIDAVPGLINLETQLDCPPDPMVRLMAIVRPHVETVTKIADRLSFSNNERRRMESWANSPAPVAATETSELRKLLYLGSRSGMLDAIRLEIVHLENRDDPDGAVGMRKLYQQAKDWEKPDLPVKGRDVAAIGIKEGPDIGDALSRLETIWIESDFTLGKDELLLMLEGTPN